MLEGLCCIMQPKGREQELKGMIMAVLGMSLGYTGGRRVRDPAY